MKKKIILAIIVMLLSSNVFAWEDKNGKNKAYSYENTTIARYQYDLMRMSSDIIRYEVDPAAQITNSASSRVETDKSLDQNGGGSK